MKTYTYNKLTKAAKEHAREWWRERISQGDAEFDSDSVIDDAKELGKLLGFDIEHVYWSGFSSQGDGACIEGCWHASNLNVSEIVDYAPKDIDLHQMAYHIWGVKLQYPNAYFIVKHSGHYYHEFCTDFDVSIADDEGDEIETPETQTLHDELIDMARKFMKWIYKQLEREWDYQFSDECIVQELTSNDLEFYHNGEAAE